MRHTHVPPRWERALPLCLRPTDSVKAKERKVRAPVKLRQQEKVRGHGVPADNQVTTLMRIHRKVEADRKEQEKGKATTRDNPKAKEDAVNQHRHHRVRPRQVPDRHHQSERTESVTTSNEVTASTGTNAHSSTNNPLIANPNQKGKQNLENGSPETEEQPARLPSRYAHPRGQVARLVHRDQRLEATLTAAFPLDLVKSGILPCYQVTQ